jgi:hypothetical protein
MCFENVVRKGKTTLRMELLPFLSLSELAVLSGTCKTLNELVNTPSSVNHLVNYARIHQLFSHDFANLLESVPDLSVKDIFILHHDLPGRVKEIVD